MIAEPIARDDSTPHLPSPANDGLRAGITVERPGFSLEVTVGVIPGSVTAIVGPNGAGKSTALRAIAGLATLSSGQVSLNGRVLEDAASGHRVPPADRGIGVVFQDYLLFPHLSARENVAFGLRARGVRRAEAVNLAQDWLHRLGIGDRFAALPRELSGGQAQRVALARALVLEPKLLLLDEPLAAIDAETRVEVRAQLAEQLRAFGGATVLVSHDPIDAMLLADEVVVLEGGRVTQQGSPLKISGAPATDYVARFMGLNLLRRASGPVSYAFAPGDCSLSAQRPDDLELADSGEVSLACTVRGVEQLGGRLRIHLETANSAGTAHSGGVVSAHPDDAFPPGQLVVADISVQQLRELRLDSPAGATFWLSIVSR